MGLKGIHSMFSLIIQVKNDRVFIVLKEWSLKSSLRSVVEFCRRHLINGPLALSVGQVWSIIISIQRTLVPLRCSREGIF